MMKIFGTKRIDRKKILGGKKAKPVETTDKSSGDDDDCIPVRDNSSAFLVEDDKSHDDIPPLSSPEQEKKRMGAGNENDKIMQMHKHVVKSAQLEDLADEQLPTKKPSFRYVSNRPTALSFSEDEAEADVSGDLSHPKGSNTISEDFTEAVDPVVTIRSNLPPDPLLSTPFGMRRTTYADYTASGRSLRFVEEYIARVVNPLYANTHTETSATGLQTTHFREEARSIILKSLHANPEKYSLIFTGTGTTGAIWKLIAILGIHCPAQLQPFLDAKKVAATKPLILCSQCEHHSNELMWRESIADVIPIPNNSTGSLDIDFLEQILQENQDKYETIIGSFTAGSNVTGLTTKPKPVADLMHQYGGYICFDYAGAAPYKDMRMDLEGGGNSYLDAIFISPHKFVGGPGTPGLLCIRRDFANCRQGLSGPPTIAGGGTVTMVWPSDINDVADSNRSYESILHVREEAGTPGVVESIRCGMAFYARDLVGAQRIEQLEGEFAKAAVERLQANKVWVMGDAFSNITSTDRLSITSFNIWAKLPGCVDVDLLGSDRDVPPGTFVHPKTGRPLMLHFHFVAALLNDLYGIQARSGCACAGPLSFRLFGRRFPFMTKKAIDELKALAEEDFHALKPGFCRVNFNYFIDKEEFEYILSAIEQIAEHGWKLLPLYAICLKTGQYWYNGVNTRENGEFGSFNRFDAIRRIQEIEFQDDGTVAWNECRYSKADRRSYLKEAKAIYDDAPNLVRQMLFRFRDLRKRNMQFPEKFQEYRFFVLASEVLPYLGITKEEVEAAANAAMAKDDSANPMIVAYPKHPTANPFFTMDRPRG